MEREKKSKVGKTQCIVYIYIIFNTFMNNQPQIDSNI